MFTEVPFFRLLEQHIGDQSHFEAEGSHKIPWFTNNGLLSLCYGKVWYILV